jgi:glycosyltransferase involved in cell wall biosynthesis
MEKMNILIWSSMFSPGGGGRLLSNLVTAIARQTDIDLVRVVVSPLTELKHRIDTSQYSNIEIIYSDEDIRLTPNHPFIIDCHVVYTFWPHGPLFRDVNRPTVITFHDVIVFDYVPPFSPGTNVRQWWRESRDWLENSTKVVVSSNYVKSRLISLFGEKYRNTAIIRHAISPSPFFENQSVEQVITTEYPFPYFVYPANTSPHKNHYNLFLAYSKFSKRHNYPLLLFGYHTEALRCKPPDWPELPFLPTLVSLIDRLHLRIDQDLFPLGTVEDQYVAPLIKNAYALIMPSLAEGGGSYPVEEALSMGVPVLCSDIPVMREHLSGRSTRVVWFNPESPDSITDAMEHLFEYYGKYKQSAQSSMNDQGTSWDEIAQQYIELFRQAYLQYHGK